MVTIENKDETNSMHGSGWLFQTERLNEPAYVEIHKSHGKMIGLVFHVGEFSLPLLRSRPYQRIHNRVERNLLHPWVMGRVTYKKKILLENAGMPSIVLKDVPDKLPSAGQDRSDDLLSAAVWINGDRLDFSELFPEEDSGYFYKEIVVTATPVLEQSFQTDALNVTMEIILSSDGPVQRTTVEVVEEPSVELDYCFMNMFPKGVTEYYAHDNHGNSLEGNLRHPSEGSNTADVSIPQAQWLAVYDPTSQFGTLIYSPDFAKDKITHLLVVDRRQDFKVYHTVGDPESLTRVQGWAKLGGLTVSPDHPQQLVLVARPIEAAPDQWKQGAEEEASQLIKKFT